MLRASKRRGQQASPGDRLSGGRLWAHGQRRASVTMHQHRSLLAPGRALKSAPSRPLRGMGLDPHPSFVRAERSRDAGAKRWIGQQARKRFSYKPASWHPVAMRLFVAMSLPRVLSQGVAFRREVTVSRRSRVFPQDSVNCVNLPPSPPWMSPATRWPDAAQIAKHKA